MTAFSKYIEGILQQISDSHTVLKNLKDKPGDLDVIKKELAKITGLLQVLANKIEANPEEASDYRYFLSPSKFYLENYDFFREIDTVSLLYSDDPMRLKGIRLTILDALDEKNLIGHISAFLRGL
ncbi:hypothetical protein QVH35_09005 [Candidatus Nitrosotenuis chungbukensis]|uniref:hypothetical protein n=1 Tax=Candidatus Nitrosotenuis chungbukensis TaxID=1353246 RepID=UPI0005B2971B|nr:hypothetical protein [Candidatus Nitrosotenuis chungbukensis]WKT57503.1 hypothetical protein QVH35_09005 [Candidatus Nitrosotenuis chungbukensis]